MKKKYHVVLTPDEPEIIAFKKSLPQGELSKTVATIMTESLKDKVATIPMSFEIEPVTKDVHTKISLPRAMYDSAEEVSPVLDPQRHIYFRIFVGLQITGILCSFLSFCFASSVPLLKAFAHKVATIAYRFNVFQKIFSTETGVAATGKPAAAHLLIRW